MENASVPCVWASFAFAVVCIAIVLLLLLRCFNLLLLSDPCDPNDEVSRNEVPCDPHNEVRCDMSTDPNDEVPMHHKATAKNFYPPMPPIVLLKICGACPSPVSSCLLDVFIPRDLPCSNKTRAAVLQGLLNYFQRDTATWAHECNYRCQVNPSHPGGGRGRASRSAGGDAVV